MLLLLNQKYWNLLLRKILFRIIDIFFSVTIFSSFSHRLCSCVFLNIIKFKSVDFPSWFSDHQTCVFIGHSCQSFSSWLLPSLLLTTFDSWCWSLRFNWLVHKLLFLFPCTTKKSLNPFWSASRVCLAPHRCTGIRVYNASGHLPGDIQSYHIMYGLVKVCTGNKALIEWNRKTQQFLQGMASFRCVAWKLNKDSDITAVKIPMQKPLHQSMVQIFHWPLHSLHVYSIDLYIMVFKSLLRWTTRTLLFKWTKARLLQLWHTSSMIYWFTPIGYVSI